MNLAIAIEFLKKLGNDIGISIDIYRILPDKPVVIFEWQGSNSSLSSLLFNSHMDVVPVDEASKSVLLNFFKNHFLSEE